MDSVRSRNSSDVIPVEKPLFPWKSWRQSWTARKDTPENDAEAARHKAAKRKSMPSLKNRLSMNLNRDLPPLPSINQWKEEVKSPQSATFEKPKHIAALWNKAAAKKSTEFSKKQKVEFRKSMEIRPSEDVAKSADFRKKAEYRKSYSDLQTAQRAQQLQQLQQLEMIHASKFESPILPHVMAPFTRSKSPGKSPKIKRKPPPPMPVKSTPTDSVMDEQVASAAAKVQLEIGPLRSPPPTDPLPAPPVPSTAPPAVPHNTAESPPAATSKQAKRRSSNYSWLPVESYVPPPSLQRRPSRLPTDPLPMGVPSSIPSHLLEQRQSSTTSAVGSVQSVDVFNTLQSTKYQFADDIDSLTPPPVPPKDNTKKKLKLPWEKKKPVTWMDEMEKLGIKDGMLMVDQLNGPPIVRY